MLMVPAIIESAAAEYRSVRDEGIVMQVGMSVIIIESAALLSAYSLGPPRYELDSLISPLKRAPTGI